MDVFILLLIIAAVFIRRRTADIKVDFYCRNNNIDWGKVNTDRIKNNYSDSEINRRILQGMYTKFKQNRR